MSSSFRADLHCHSNFSDGTDTPERLIDKAIEIGLKGLSITDHDTVSAYERAIPYAKQKGLDLLVGVEFSSFIQSEPVHILGYRIDLKNEELLQLCNWHKKRRERRNLEIISKLQLAGIAITYDELLEKAVGKTQTLGRPHIAVLLIEKGVVPTIKKAFEEWIGEGKRAYVPGDIFPIESTIDVIHRAKGVAVLAHPHLIRSKKILKKILGYSFDGIEGFYARMTSNQELPFVRMGQERRLIVTGGSDYHGEIKEFNLLGSSWVDEKTFKALNEWPLINQVFNK